MSYSENAFAMASRSTPVRDELVLSLDDIFPMLKSAEGIPVEKHTKRGQKEDRRLRLDTDVSTLEVFRTSVGYLGYLHRKVTRSYKMSTLEEVGPASSVPGGHPATPGRTLHFVFGNRNLYVTVKSREVCAALVALFRPAGGPASHASPPSGGTAHASGDDADASVRRRHASPSSTPPGLALWADRPHRGRRVSDTVTPARRQEQLSIGAGATGSGSGGRRIKGADDGSGAGNGYGALRGRMSHPGGVLKRSASYTAGPESFELGATSTSSSDVDEMVVSTSMEVRQPDMPSETPPLSGRSGRSPNSSTRSSESPDARMRSRVVGFGSAEQGMDAKPKRAGRTSALRPPWARFTDSDRKGTAAAAATTRLKNAGLAVEDEAPMSDPRQKTGGASAASAETPGTGEATDPSGFGSAGAAASGRDGPSPLAVRFEDRLKADSLRRPVSAPAGVTVSEGRRALASQGQEGSHQRSTSRTANSSPSGKQASGKASPLPPPLQRVRGSAPPEGATRPDTSQQVPSAVMLQKEGDFSVVFSLRGDSPPALRPAARPPPARNEHSVQFLEAGRKTPPPLKTSLRDDAQNKAQGLAEGGRVREPISAVYRDSSYESSLSPPPSKYGAANGARAIGVERTKLMQEFARSSSVDSLEGEGPYPVHRPADPGTLASYLEDGGGDVRNATGGVSSTAHRGGRPASEEVTGAHDRGRSAHDNAAAEDHDKVPVTWRDAEDDVPFPSPDLAARNKRDADADGRVEGETVASSSVQAASAVNGPTVARFDSFGPLPDSMVSRLTIETAHSQEYAAPSEAGTTTVRPGTFPFAATPADVPASAFNNRGSRGSRGSYGRRGSAGTDCTSPDSPPGGAVGEVRASILRPPVPRPIPLMTGLYLGGAVREHPQGPSGFEELWAVLESGWGINSSFGTSFAPKVMLLSGTYEKMRSFQAAAASVCVQACGPVLGEVCGRCGRAWAVLTSASLQSIAKSRALPKIEAGLGKLVEVVERYEASAVVRRFTLPLIGAPTAWEELLTAGEGGDLLEPCQQIERAIALLPEEQRDGGKDAGGGGDSLLESAGVGAGSLGGRRSFGGGDLRLPPCPSYWAKEQFDRLTPHGLPDVLATLHEPARFAELAQLVTRASDVGPAKREYSLAWDCVRRVEGPALGRELRRALSATLVAAGQLLPLPRVPPPPPAYVTRERLTEQIEATILHPFLPLGIAGIGGASGSGKTVLAAAVVRDATVRCRFGDRVFWLHAGKGARDRLISLLQTLADTLYAWLTEGEHRSKRGRFRGSVGGGSGGRGGGDAAGGADRNLREPVRFRDQDQAVNYVADLSQGPLLAGLRCLVVLDDVHEREVVDALWKSGCQLLVTSPVEGLLQAVGAEATMAEPLGVEVAKQVAAGAAGEAALCDEASGLVNLCRGCPLALAMSGAVVQAVLSAGTESREWRKPRLPHPTPSGGDAAGGEGGGTESAGGGPISSGWSLGLGSTISSLAAPVGAWVEQVVVGTSSVPNRQQQAAGAAQPQKGRRPIAAQPTATTSDTNGDRNRTAAAGPRLSLEATVWANLTQRVEGALAALQENQTLWALLTEAGPEREMPVRGVVAVLTELALEEADRILGGAGRAVECYISFALLPEGLPLPPPALEEFWGADGEGEAGSKGAASAGDADFPETHRAPTPVEVFEALRVVGRAGGGEGADGLIPHGLQRVVVLYMAQRYPETMAKMLRRRVRVLSRISSLVGTFDDDCWALGGRGVGQMTRGAGARSGDRSDGAGGGSARRVGKTEGAGDPEVDSIPTGLLGNGRPGQPSHGYGGFSRYDSLVASWDALPAAHTLTAAAAEYLASVRAACTAAGFRSMGGDGGKGIAGAWAAARALASAADLQALAGRGSEAIPAYGEACALLAAEAVRSAEVVGVPQWQRTARNALHKVASMVQELAVLAAQLGKEAPAIRLLQRAVEIHLSVLEASGMLVPYIGGSECGGGGLQRSEGSEGEQSAKNLAGAAGNSTSEIDFGHDARGRGGSITCRAVADDERPLASRLWLQPFAEAGEPSPSSRSSGGGGIAGVVTPPVFGRLDVVGTCVGDLGLVLACTRQLRQEKKVDESILLAEKVYPVLKEILGADHAFTKAALAAFVGQGIVDECWSNTDVDIGAVGHPSLPSPTSRRRLARSYEGRGLSTGVGGSAGSGAGAGKTGSSAAASTLSELSSPPSPLPEEFYSRYSPAPHQGSARTPSSGTGAGGAGPDGSGGRLGVVGSGGGGDSRQRDRSCSAFSNNSSTSSGTDADDGDDSDTGGRGGGASSGLRRAGPVGRGGSSLPFPRRSFDRPPNGWRLEAQGWQREAGSTSAGARGVIEPASTRMQQEFYFRHRTRRARAHAFLVTAATRARLKNADRAEAGLFLLDLARQAGANSSSAGEGLMSPDGTNQMARLTALTRRP